AEDGIRGFHVTGVQTCALPIFFADTVPGMQGLRRGDIDVSMETWVDNIHEIWDEVIAEGTVVDLGPNFPNAPQGWYVPTYMIEEIGRASCREGVEIDVAGV